MFVTYPDVAYLSGCVLVADDLGPSTRAGPRLCLLVSGVAPLRWVLRQFGGGVMLPHWRHAPSLVSCPGLVLCGQRGWFPDNVARNSPAAAPNLDFASLELQRFGQCSKNDRGELRATFIRRGPVIPPWSGSAALSAPSSLVACGVRSARPPGPQRLSLLIAELATNFACNSPVTISNLEFTALELQRFRALLNLRPIELHATFGGERQASLPAAPSTWLE